MHISSCRSQQISLCFPRAFRTQATLLQMDRWTLRGSCPATPLRPFTEAKRAYPPRPSWLFMRRAFPAPPSGPTPSPHLPRELAFIFKVTLSDRHPLFARSPDPASPCPMRGDNCLLPPRQSCSSASPRACAAPLIAHSNDLVAPQASPPLERAFLEGSEWPPHG